MADQHILDAHYLTKQEAQIPREDWFEASDTLQHLRKQIGRAHV